MIYLPMIAVLIVIIFLAVMSVPAIRLKQELYKKTGKHPIGYYLGYGIAFGMLIGIPMGISVDNIALGPAMGLPLGIAIGAGLEQKYKKELRPLTKEEKDMQKKLLLILLAVGTVSFFAFLYAASL